MRGGTSGAFTFDPRPKSNLTLILPKTLFSAWLGCKGLPAKRSC